MIEYIKDFLDNDQSRFVFFGIIVSAMGGMANWLLSDNHTFFRFFVAVFLAGFAGFLVGELCLAANIEGGWAFFICGSAGLSGEAVLKLSRKYVINKVSFITGQEYDESDDQDKKKIIPDPQESENLNNKENSQEKDELYILKKALKNNTLSGFIKRPKKDDEK